MNTQEIEAKFEQFGFQKPKATLYYIVNARMPSDKAHAIQIANMCAAFIEIGVDLKLVVPNRPNLHEGKNIKEYYDLRVDIPVVYLPAFNLWNYGRVGYRLSAYSFMVTSWLYMRFCVDRNLAVVYTVDLDDFSYNHLPHI